VTGRPSPKKIVALDWDTRTLRIVHALLGKRGVKIDRLLSSPIPPDLDPTNPEQLGRHIRRVMDQEGIQTKHATCDIPRDQAILKTLSLPALPPDEMAGMVGIQIAKELPFPATEAVIDFAVPPSAGSEATTDVLVAAVRREVVQQYEATFEVAGLKLDRVGLRPYANTVAVCELLKHALPERVMFIDVRPLLTEINVIRNGLLVFSRAASVMVSKEAGERPRFSIVREGAPARDQAQPRAAVLLTEDSDLRGNDELGVGEPPPLGNMEAMIHSLVVEVTRSIEAYRAGDPGAPGNIDHMVIAGDLGIEETLAEAIQKRLGITTELYNPAASFGWEPDEGAGASAFASTLGLVVGHSYDQTVHFDFLHPKKRTSQTQERLKKAPLVAAVAVLFVAAGGIAFAKFTAHDRDHLARIESTIRELEEKSSDNKKFLEVMEQIRDFDAEQHVWVDVLYDLFSALPTNEYLVINHLELNQSEGRLVLKTRAKDRDTATTAVRKLDEFRREGKDRPRFKTSIGPQTEKRGEKYAFVQDLRVTILRDDVVKKGSTKSKPNG